MRETNTIKKENVNLSKKKTDNHDYIKLLFNNRLEQRCYEISKEYCLEKDRQYYEENEERLQKWPLTNTRDYLNNKEIRKKNMQDIDFIMRLRKTNKS